MDPLRLESSEELEKLRDFFEPNPQGQKERSLGVLAPILDRGSDLLGLLRLRDVFEEQLLGDRFEDL